ncbi:hypothetical protein EU527_12435 [Candidatus Thorarchaeota archaeon]|nr:MAG: hypothetical protein EU527_12435 [Candidatus Thorarchaeota archaeon]
MNLEQLVCDYAPILNFHPDEGDFCCFPSDAEEVYQKFHRDWTKFQEDRSPAAMIPTTPCYYETWNDDDMIQIRYWFWYRYNDFPKVPFGLGKHIGDWEHVEVRLYDGTSPRDAIWFLSNHLEARITSFALTIQNIHPETPLLDGTHVRVWVALGSHANYPSPMSAPRCYGKIICDRIQENGEIWYTEQGLKPLEETNFHDFKGRWGNEKSPRSPMNEYNNRWRNYPNIEPDTYSPAL